MTKRIVLLGPPGSGKGTQGELLRRKLQIPRLSVGALIRRHLTNQTDKGTEAEKYITQGKAIPAQLLMQLLGEWMFKHPKGFIIDNLVRTREQLDHFKEFQQQYHIVLDKVFYLKISEVQAYSRLKKRHLTKQRPDETRKAIHHRFLTFYQDMQYIFDFFKKQGIFEEIDAERSPTEVHQAIMRELDMEL